MSGFFQEYPYTNFNDLNLDFVFRKLYEMEDKLKKYVEQSTISFHDPITWDITDQYTVNTMVVDSDGTAYLSVKPVPVGISITNTNYWQPIFNYDDSINKLRSSIATVSTPQGTAPKNLKGGDLIWYNGKLYEAKLDIAIGSLLIPDTNIKLITVEDWVNYLRINLNSLNETVNNNYSVLDSKINSNYSVLDSKINSNYSELNSKSDSNYSELDGKINSNYSELNNKINSNYLELNNKIDLYERKTVIDYGAKGDGVTDDTAAFKSCIENEKVIIVPNGKTYILTDKLILHESTMLTSDNFVPNSNTILKFTSDDANRCGLVMAGRSISIQNIDILETSKVGTGITFGEGGSQRLSHYNSIKNVYIYNFNVAIGNNALIWDCTIENVRINDSNIGMDIGYYDGNNFALTLTNVYFDGCLSYNLRAINTKCTFIGCNFGFKNGTILSLNSGCYCTFIGCNFETDEENTGNLIRLYSEMFYFISCTFRHV